MKKNRSLMGFGYGLLALTSWAAHAAPVVGAPNATFMAPESLGRNYVAVKVEWSVPDPSKVSRCELEQKVEGQNYSEVPLAQGLVTETNMNLVLATSQQFRIKAYDSTGGAGGWIEAPSFKVDIDRESSAAITYTGEWKQAPSGGPRNWGAADRFVRTTSAAGASASYSFSGKSIAWVSTMGPEKGKAEVLIDGTSVGSVDLIADDEKPEQVVFAKNDLDPAAAHKIEIKAVSGAVDVFGFVRISLR